jgi:hypothetical protein
MIMITRKQIEEILDDTLEGDNPPDSAPTVVGKEECVNRLMELVKNCSIPHVSVSLFNEALRVLRDLAEHQNGAPLIRHEKEYNETMHEVWDFLEANET